MTTAPAAEPAEETIELKDPAFAALLAWLVPGLGHWYQGRKPKAVLYFVCIMGTFVFGVVLGGGTGVDADKREHRLGYGRAVYFPWRSGDHWLAYPCQIGVGLPTVPMTLIQASRMSKRQGVWFDGFMAPPRVDGAPLVRPDPMGGNTADPNASQPTADDLHRLLHHYFELATLFTEIAGLLNVLAIYDAFAGPVVAQPPAKKEDEEEDKDKEKTVSGEAQS